MSIAISVFVRLSVCLSDRFFEEPEVQILYILCRPMSSLFCPLMTAIQCVVYIIFINSYYLHEYNVGFHGCTLTTNCG